MIRVVTNGKMKPRDDAPLPTSKRAVVAEPEVIRHARIYVDAAEDRKYRERYKYKFAKMLLQLWDQRR